MIDAVRSRRLCGVLLAAALLLATRQARADARTEKAREHYLQGNAYYKLDKYKEALGEYEQAYIAKQDASFLYNIAQCHRLMGNRADAVKFYQRYLKDAPGAPNREVAEKHIRDLEAALAHGPEGGEAPGHPVAGAGGAADGAPAAGASNGSGALPGPVVVTTPAPLTPQQLALNAPPPSGAEPAATTLSDSGAPATGGRDEHHPFYTRWWFWTAVGAAVVGGIVIAVAASHDPACPTGSICK
jgi:hypothetical protein